TNNVNQLPVFIINKQKKKVKCVIKGQIKIIKNQIVNLEVMVKVEDTLIINLNKPNSYKSSIRIDLHDLGNIMTIINGNLHLLRTKYQIDDSNEIYNNLIRASNAGTNLIKKMILTNSKSRAEFIIVDLHDIILQAIDLSKWTMEKIKIILDLRAKESKLFGDQNNLLNSIINIIINARDAMSEGGHLYISTSNIYEELIFQRENETVKNNKFIDVRIMDTGTGIEPDIQEFIFDPFFTTKGNGGTGLGLAGVQSTIFKHFGIINLVNSNSNGSEFQIILPLI
ncbi:MAG: HAMP domain-containing histidine kinase, partial [Candidatus Heimdallarchaeota archaeon]|nr:HAMP domain-containing histidine kinase [Candidatus Heimdallarchaeota archaeon]